MSRKERLGQSDFLSGRKWRTSCIATRTRCTGTVTCIVGHYESCIDQAGAVHRRMQTVACRGGNVLSGIDTDPSMGWKRELQLFVSIGVPVTHVPNAVLFEFSIAVLG